MNNYHPSIDEKKYLEKYNIADFERPSLATDIVIFSIMNEGVRASKRHIQKKQLKVLLIKRASYPYKDKWALPGGFCIPGEDVLETAMRELKEETNVKNAYLKLTGTYGEMGRDPRGWIISNTFMALMDGESCSLRGGSDAWEARWFSIDVDEEKIDETVTKTESYTKIKYNITLKNEDINESLYSSVIENRKFEHYHETNLFEIIESDDIAFDHSKIILEALIKLRKEAEDYPQVVFDLMPEEFTLTQLQNAFEIVLNKKLLPANFRRKIISYVEETEKIIEGEGYRPAKLFIRNIKAFS